MKKPIPTLKKLFNLETMAVQIYAVQIPRLRDPGERQMMTVAMENETLHRETFRGLLKKRGASPSPLHLAWWLVGVVLGVAPALLGRVPLLRGDVAFESKAVREYSVFASWDIFTDEEIGFIRRFLEDEKRHVANWRGLLAKGQGAPG